MALEIIGVILSAIPLVIMSFDASALIVKVLSTQEGFPSQLNRLKSTIDNQRTLFRHRANRLQAIMNQKDLVTSPSQRSSSTPSSKCDTSYISNPDEIVPEDLEDLLPNLKSTINQIRQDLDSITDKVIGFSPEGPDAEVSW